MATLEKPQLKIPVCPECQEKREGKFCFKCGTENVEGMRTCPCGYDNIWPHENFCQACGKRAGEE
jgi:hypothetical protein